ncbi:MAG: type IV pilus assembly protein PilM [Capsulimonadales bacterium]|nr:type IV pilus assembly protein PilM [Capsulimonadales bacterium]
MSALASLFGKETFIGIDIGSANLKAVQVEPQRDRFRIVRAAQQKTPAGALRDGVISDRGAVSSALKQMLKAANISANSAVLAVSGPTVMVRQIKMPRMPEAALLKSARYEAGKFVSSSIDDSALAFEILGAVPDEPNQMEVMMVAAPKEMVEARIESVEKAGLEAAAVDTTSFALVRALVDCNRRYYEDGALRALVEIGATQTEVILLQGPDFALSRSIPISGNTLSDALKNQLRVDENEAERRKTELDLSVLIQGGDAEMLETARVLQSVVDELLREVRRSASYYQSQVAESRGTQPLAEILLSGGTAQMMGLPQYVTARLGVDARVASALDSPLFEAAPEAEEWLRDQAPRLAVCLGLAVKEYMSSVTAKA